MDTEIGILVRSYVDTPLIFRLTLPKVLLEEQDHPSRFEMLDCGEGKLCFGTEVSRNCPKTLFRVCQTSNDHKLLQ